MSDQPIAETSTWQHTTLNTDIRAPGGIRTYSRSKRAAADLRLRPRGRDRREDLLFARIFSFQEQRRSMESVKRPTAKLWSCFNNGENKGSLFSLPWAFINLDLSHVPINNTREQCNVVCFSKMSQAFNVTLNSGWWGSKREGRSITEQAANMKRNGYK